MLAKDNETLSWIFLATAMASQTAPADFSAISTMADAINHAVPTHKELQTSLTRLTNIGFMIKTRNKYSLTEKGKSKYNTASQNTSTLSKIWDNLEMLFKETQD